MRNPVKTLLAAASLVALAASPAMAETTTLRIQNHQSPESTTGRMRASPAGGNVSGRETWRWGTGPSWRR